MSHLDHPRSLNPCFQEPVENEHTVLDCPIFNEEGDEIAMGSIDVEYYQVGSKTFIVNTVSACHPDDVSATLYNEFKNYERV